MNSTWFRVARYTYDIQEIEVIAETPKTLKIQDRFRRDKYRVAAKSSGYDSYFPTRQEAKEFLVGRCVQTLSSAKRQFELAEAMLKKVTDL